VIAILLAYFASRWRALLLRERSNGRFDPLPSPDIIDEAWLRQHVFSRLPEEVGAAWDRRTSASEVAALIARLELEGKLKTSLEAGRGARQDLRMELLCDRGQLAPHERALVDALFFDGTGFTSAAAIRKHYSKSGFDPAALIRRTLELRVPSVYAKRIVVPPAVRWVTAVLLITGLALALLGGVRAPETVGVAIVCLMTMLPLYAIALLLALRYRNKVHDLAAPLGWALVTAATPGTALGIILAGGLAPLFPLQMAGLALVAAGLTSSLFNAMRSRDTAEALALRRTLAFARRHFERELAAPAPRLRDEWFPYLLAFGLGPHVDRWFRAQRGHDASAAAGAIAQPAPHSGSGGGWSGGGGAFGGGGATGSWVSAVSGVSAGVSAASSSSGSSGSSSSSGGSSGGGGGGGW
jgi:hypothetical protein